MNPSVVYFCLLERLFLSLAIFRDLSVKVTYINSNKLVGNVNFLIVDRKEISDILPRIIKAAPVNIID